MTIRSAISAGTGFSPAKLNLGRQLLLPIDNVLDTDSVESSPVTYDEYVDHFSSSLRTIMKKASSAIQANQDRQRKYYNSKHRGISYELGQLVWLRTHSQSNKRDKFARKLAPLYSGPFKIPNKLSDVPIMN
jgi:hypothetical protein